MNRLIRKKFQNDMRGICEKKSSLTSKSNLFSLRFFKNFFEVFCIMHLR
jgi:hypothetical protein